MTTGLRRRAAAIARPLGVIVLVASVAWVVGRIVEAGSEIASWSPPPGTLVVVTLACAVSAASMWLTVGVWMRALDVTASDAASGPARRSLVCIHALSQIVKYLPGNVFHLAGRHVATTAALGGASWVVVRAAVIEAGLLAAAAVMTASAFLVAADGETTSEALRLVPQPIGPWGGGFLLIAAASGLVVMARSRTGTRSVELRHGFAGAAWGVGFFVVQGAILATLLRVVTGVWIGAAFVAAPIAWLLGFVVPGAPAGLGVREAVLIAMLSGVASEPDAVLATLIFRFVNVAGDLLFFGSAVLLAGGMARARLLSSPPPADRA